MFVSRKSLIHSLLNGISSSFIVMINENYVQILNTTFRFYNEKSNHILKIVSNAITAKSYRACPCMIDAVHGMPLNEEEEARKRFGIPN